MTENYEFTRVLNIKNGFSPSDSWLPIKLIHLDPEIDTISFRVTIGRYGSDSLPFVERSRIAAVDSRFFARIFGNLG